MTDTRMKNRQWQPAETDGRVPTWERVNLAVLLDIRDELQTLNRLLGCQNFTDVPNILRAIQYNTKKPRKRKTAKR